jgi:hypothetical protein
MLLGKLHRLDQEILHRPEDKSEWSAKLMAHIGKEEGLGAIDFSQCFRPFAGLFIRASVGQSRHYLSDI